MNRCFVKRTLFAGCALFATQAFAQSMQSTSAPPPDAAQLAPKAAAKPVAKPASKAPPARFADAGARTALPAQTNTFTAAGSVIVLADGIVANATMAQIQPPADGFAYER